MVGMRTYRNACNRKYAVSLHVNFCFLHARMPMKTETNFLTGVLHELGNKSR